MKKRRAWLMENETPAEKSIKIFLARSGIQTKAQVILGCYLADIIVMNKSLVVEIDGPSHNSAKQKEHDEKRTRFLKRCGFSVLRFSNSTALDNPALVLNEINAVPNTARKMCAKSIARANYISGPLMRKYTDRYVNKMIDAGFGGLI